MADLSRLPLDPGEVLGAEVAKGLATLLGTAHPLHLTRELQRGGVSGATVVAATIDDLVTRTGTQQLIVKFDPDPGIRAGGKQGKNDARREAGEFRRHLAEHATSFVLESLGTLSFHKIVKDDLERWGPLSRDLPPHRRAALLEEITRRITVPWNQTQPDHQRVTPREAMEADLGVRIQPGGKIHQWATRRKLLDPARRWITVGPGGGKLPNPFQLMTLTGPPVSTWYGPAHGDLHPGNVLVQLAGESVDFVLIDLDRYSSEAPLSRDPLHLLLTMLDWDLPDLGAAEKHALIDLLVGEEGAGKPVHPDRRHLVEAYENAAAGGGGGGRGDLWRMRRRLSLVACALMFPVRLHTLKRDTWWWYVQLAGKATEAVLRSMDIRLPDGEAVEVKPHQVVAERAEFSAGTDWDDLSTVLKRTFFDPRSWRTFAVSAEELAALLEGPPPPVDGHSKAITSYFRKLRILVQEGGDPEASPQRVAMIAKDADMYRNVLIKLIERQ
ncbi:hypothetical protein [Nonomuraea sp. NPDC048826]|uniref:hypothetical protein n=1 Tax=Nonomuraea sp. NPDC048826 TaxID=3364347 RepID=UPI00371D0A18